MRNRIDKILSSGGTWILAPSDIIIEFMCLSLWSSPPQVDSSALWPWPSLSSEDATAIVADFSVIEVRRILMSLSPSPGPDGFTAKCFQSFWHTHGDLLMRAFREFHDLHYLPPAWGNTHLCFIPKCHHPIRVKHFRPIVPSVILLIASFLRSWRALLWIRLLVPNSPVVAIFKKIFIWFNKLLTPCLLLKGINLLLL